jgi:transposase
LGRTLDWLYEHDVTTLFAGLALQARRRFGIAAQHLHIDTTSFSVSGDYASKEEGDPVPVAITYGYSRDHRADLKQWMLALATTHEGDVPLFLRPLDGNSSDKEHLSAAVREVMTQLRAQVPEEQEQRIAVFDSGGYSEANMKSYNDANIWWISRVPETSTAAKSALEEEPEQWQALSDGSGEYVVRTMELPQGKERWVIVRTHAQVQATQEQMEKQVKKTQQEWEKRLWHLSKQAFGCQTDARTAWEKALKGKPSWLIATFTLKAQKQYEQRGRAKKEGTPDQTVWSLIPTLAVDQAEVTALARKKAAFIVATNILDAQRLSPEQVISTYKEQGGVERGFRFLKDPLFLASSVFVKKPERVIALPLRDGALLVGVSPGRTSAASPTGGNGTNRPQSGQQTDQPPHDALDFPLF